ncbi:metalloprotease [Leptobacterium flavescens]|uniref:Metalloprotease n=1 Tax=Leptobacterium flavescens TaxID=472055 RepID=A0A6P0UJC2_9FLAO|nr:metalloprotease [Leptobacterium flavescens]
MYSAFLCLCCTLGAQNSHKINATLHQETNSINIQQEVVFFNSSKDTLNSIYLTDWNNAYASKKTALARRFAEEFDKSLHLAKDKERGYTNVISITDRNFNFLKWERLPAGDLIRVQLNFPIYPGQEYTFKLSYTVQLPRSKFTRYGHTPQGNYNLRYWYISPAVYRDGEWKLYSNTDLDDQYTYASDYELVFNYPKGYKLHSDLNVASGQEVENYMQIILNGKDRGDLKLFLERDRTFEYFQNEKLTLITNIEARGMQDVFKAISVDKVINFIHRNLGSYPHERLLVSDLDYKKNPLYGLNQLPSFLRPFPEEFQYELKLLKTSLKNWLENTVYVDPRGERWTTDAIQNYLMIKYVDEYYPDMKLLGKVSNLFIVRSFHLAKLNFNDQYPFLSMLMARRNQDQPLSTPADSLVKFNEKISNKYKAGLGLVYLDNYLMQNHIDNRIRTFYKEQSLKDINASYFEDYLKEGSPKDIDWFFDFYIRSRDQIDFKIKKAKKVGDSVYVTIKNKSGTNVPITLFGLKKDSVVSKQWFTDIKEEETFKIARNGAERLVLNYDKTIPEFNQRDNWKSLNGFFSSNKKLQFKFFKDAENPYYNQIFFVPTVTFNVYDKLTPGLRLHNKTFLRRPFVFDLQPAYSSGERTLVGSGSIAYIRDLRKDDQNLFRISYSLRASTFHFAPASRFISITPSVSLSFRTNDFRSNKLERFQARYVNIIRNRSIDVETDPDYSVFNARYRYSDNGIVRFLSYFADVQVAQDFAKIAFSLNYRKLFQNNRQLNLRLFAGKFIYNSTNSDFFSFALDRPTDYLFDFNYLGRSEDSGIFSQQIIIAEGGFKSQLEDPFSNNWLVTGNASFNLWKWVELYGDVGLLKNQTGNPRFVYDSGIRLNLVTDYFELYFPLYSNKGFEPSQPNYDQQIRFVVTLSPRTLLGLFTRKWF